MSRTIEKRHRKISSFLKTLREMLNNQPPQYISWGSQQNEFTIRNPSRFSEEVLPKYFKHSNLSSFIRQLNIYDFKKVHNEKYPFEYIYSHPHFDKNNPDLMNNIFRKVHHLPSKYHKSSHQEIGLSSDSFENSTTNQKKKLKDEIDKLEHKLAGLRSANQLINDENLQLKARVPIVKNLNAQTSKNFYKILMKSYELQYLKYTQIIHHQLIGQEILFNQLYYQKHQEPINFQTNAHTSKHSINEKTKFDSTNYNSTSSGGSLNGHSSRQKAPSYHSNHEKFNKKSDKKNQPLLREQNNLKISNPQRFNSEIQILLPTQTFKSQGKITLQNHQDLQGSMEENEIMSESLDSKRQNICPEQQINNSPSRCVIDLRNRRTEQQNDLSRMYRAIVLNPKHLNSELNGFTQSLPST